MTNILVTGAAGYIGAHMVKLLCQRGLHPVALDNLCEGRSNIIVGGTFIKGDVEDGELIGSIVKEHRIDAVLHFAAHVRVEESMRDPAKYLSNNTASTLRLLETLVRNNVKTFVFSSTATLYGEPEYIPIDENHPLAPINVYGLSKYLVEKALPEYERAYGLRAGCLRYFNAAGADPEAQLGQLHEPRSHLISVALDVANGKLPAVPVYGNDYDTADGTCIRDYVHVQDLCEAHMLLLEYMQQGGQERIFNLGTGQGHSVLEVLECAREVANHPIPAVMKPRRPGDPARLCADSRKAQTELGWKTARSDLKTIIEDAWRWEQRP